MLSQLYFTPFTAGFIDGLNPCFLMTFSLILLGMLWFKQVGISRWWVAFFIGWMIFDTFAFNCGFLDSIVLSDLFQLLSRVLYIVFALFVGFKGFQFLKEWHALSKGREVKKDILVHKKVSVVVLMSALFGLALLLSMIATLWPINSYIMTFSVYMMMPGQLIVLGSLIFLYTLITFWFVVVGLLIFRLESRNERLFKVTAAAILLSASLGVIDIIFTKG